jgi:hypothetical protein
MVGVAGGPNASEIRGEDNNQTFGAAPDAARTGYVTSKVVVWLRWHGQCEEREREREKERERERERVKQRETCMQV